MRGNAVSAMMLILLLIGILPLVFNIQPVKADSPLPLVSLNPLNTTVPSGLSFNVSVNIWNVTDMWGIAIRLGYNASTSEAIRVYPGDVCITQGTLDWVPVNASGHFNFDKHPTINNTRLYAPDYAFVSVGVLLQTPNYFTGSGEVFKIEFTAKAVGNSSLDLFNGGPDEVELVDNWADPIPHSVLDGSVTVVTHTLTVYSLPAGVTFTVDGAPHTTPWAETYGEGTLVSLIMPELHTAGDVRYSWDQWSDGNTSRTRAIKMDTAITLTAQYTILDYQLTVTSVLITGITFTINGNPQTTPYTEWLVEESYTLIMPETHNLYVWSHWLEDGDTNRTKVITLSGTTWTAVYLYEGDCGLTIYSSPSGVTFTVDGIPYTTPWSGNYPQGTTVSLEMPASLPGYGWYRWIEDGAPNRIKTLTLTAAYTTLTGEFVLLINNTVGGEATPIIIPANKPELLAPYIRLTTLLVAAAITVVYAKKRKRNRS